MKAAANCLCSAAAGAILTFLAVCPTWGPLKLMKTAHAQQTDSPATKSASGVSLGSANVKVDDGNVDAVYANFARVTATPEEVIIDYALNPQPFAAGEQRVIVSRRLVLNFYTTKRLWIALQQTLERHESTFGPIELDVRKRAISKD
jgi:hypothetical protein